MRSNLRMFIRLTLLAAGACSIVVLTQDLHIYPGGTVGKLWNLIARAQLPQPPGVESFFIRTSDGESIHVWYQPVARGAQGSPRFVGVVAHGNGGTVGSFYGFQEWLNTLGIPSYGFDYRGYGESTGWPSEEGIFRDTEAVVEEALRREGMSPEQLILIGYSLGSAPAARVTLARGARALVLFAPFTSLRDVVNDLNGYRYLAPFLWSKLPTAAYVAELRKPCLMLVHGALDHKIPLIHSKRLAEIYRGHGGVFAYFSPIADHENILDTTRSHITPALKACLEEDTCEARSRSGWSCPS